MKHCVKASVLAVGVCCAVSVSALNLSQSIEHAVMVNPGYSAAHYAHMQADAASRVALGAMLPSLNLNASRGRQWSDNTTTRQNPNVDGFLALNTTEYSATLSQMLFNAVLYNQYKEQKATALASLFDFQGQYNTLSMQVVNNYFDIRRYRNLLKQAKNLVAKDAKLYKLASTKVSSGIERQSSIELMLKQLNSDKAQITEIKTSLAQAENNFRQFVQLSPKTLSSTSIPTKIMPKSLSQAKHWLNSNTQLRADKAKMASAYYGVDAAKSQFLPTLNLQASSSTNRNLQGLPGRDTTHTIAVVASFNLFHGGSDFAAVKQKSDQYHSLAATYANNKLQLNNQLENFWVAYHNAFDNVKELKALVSTTKKTTQLYYQEFKIGRRSLFDLVQVENMLFQARSRLLNAEYLQKANAFQILALTNHLKQYH